MAKQTDTAQFNITSFLENGALIRVAPDLFKAITGPFTRVPLNENQLQISRTLIYQPDFWDFLQAPQAIDFAYEGRVRHDLTRNQLLGVLKSLPLKPPQITWKAVATPAFRKQFDWSQQQFQQNRLQKTVPIILQSGDVQLSVEGRASMLQNLVHGDYIGWTYGFWQNGAGYFGQTPELIAEWTEAHQVLKTAAVAGTLKNTPENETALVQDPKIREEHDIVVRDIEERLQQNISSRQIKKSATAIQKLKHLLHLKTDFQCTDVSWSKAFAVIKTLHPTAALGLYPRDPLAMKSFSQLEAQNDRKSFAAPFALIQSDQILCVAGIRNLFFDANQVRVISGCGVTAESHFESECEELHLKRDSVKRMMGIFE